MQSGEMLAAPELKLGEWVTGKADNSEPRACAALIRWAKETRRRAARHGQWRLVGGVPSKVLVFLKHGGWAPATNSTEKLEALSFLAGGYKILLKPRQLFLPSIQSIRE